VKKWGSLGVNQKAESFRRGSFWLPKQDSCLEASG
jgi:hypothetical protein